MAVSNPEGTRPRPSGHSPSVDQHRYSQVVGQSRNSPCTSRHRTLRPAFNAARFWRTPTRERAIMNWEAISAIGEIVGAAAVVLSLLYLSIQVRQSTRVARASTRHEITQSAMVGGRLLAESDGISELILRRVNGDELTPQSTYASWVWPT